VTSITDTSGERVYTRCHDGRSSSCNGPAGIRPSPVLEKITALLVSDGREPFEKLELALDNQGVKTCRTASSAEVLPLLEKPDSPQMIFTDTGQRKRQAT